MTMETALITTSRMRSFNACRRMHHLQFVLGYRAIVDREAAEFGTIGHAGLEAWWLAYAEGRELLACEEAQAAVVKAVAASVAKGNHLDEATAVKADLLMLGYHARWAPTMAEYEVIAVERQFEAPLPTPAGAKRVRGLKIAGKLDVLLRKRCDRTVWFCEHKFTTADLTPGSTYWARLRMDTQVSVYFEGTRVLGYEPVGCIYDVISKPLQRPLKATPPDKRKYKKGTTELWANQREHDETMEEFRERMMAEIVSAPEAYFLRAEVVRLEAELEESRRDTYQAALLIRETAKREWSDRNPDACFLWGRPCDFYDHCAGGVSIDDETRFKRLDNVHPELERPEAA